MHCISYKSGYKYQLVDEHNYNIPINPETEILSPTGYLKLSIDGDLKIKKGYAWDGPSGPTFDTLNFMRGSLIHDALYQLMRESLLDGHVYRKVADKLLRKMCKEDGMSSIRAWWVYHGLRIGGDPAADPDKKKPAKKAPNACQNEE